MELFLTSKVMRIIGLGLAGGRGGEPNKQINKQISQSFRSDQPRPGLGLGNMFFFSKSPKCVHNWLSVHWEKHAVLCAKLRAHELWLLSSDLLSALASRRKPGASSSCNNQLCNLGPISANFSELQTLCQ